MFDQCVQPNLFANAVVLVDFKKPIIHVSSQYLLEWSRRIACTSQTFESRLANHLGALVVISNDLCDYGIVAEGLHAEGATTSVDLALRRLKRPLPELAKSCECTKAWASFIELVMADIIVSVFPRPMSSASIPPLGESGFTDVLDPRIAC